MYKKAILIFFIGILHVNLGMSQANWKHFEFEDLTTEHLSAGKNYLKFLDEPSLSMGLYVLEQDEEDKQQPHKLDEIYYVMSGTAELVAGSKRYSVKQGSILFVRAEVDHKFINISADLKVLVVFSNTPFNREDLESQKWELEDLSKRVSENEWNQFANFATLRMGLYMLPKKINGDNTLTHTVDEINIVVKGESAFKVGQDEINVSPGSIIWVKEGIGHSFYNLSDDFEVLILFHKKG